MGVDSEIGQAAVGGSAGAGDLPIPMVTFIRATHGHSLSVVSLDRMYTQYVFK